MKIKKITKTSNYDIPYYVTNLKKIIKEINWTPKKNKFEIIKDIYIWMNNNKKKLKGFFK